MSAPVRRRSAPTHLFDVTINGFDPVIISAASRGGALYDAFLSYSECRDCTFRQFLAIAKIISRTFPPADDGYGYVRRAYGVDPRIGQRARLTREGPEYNGREGTIVYPGRTTAYVELVLDGEDRVSIVHPSNVELLSTSATGSKHLPMGGAP